MQRRRRTLFRHGGSWVLTIPRDWVAGENLESGSQLEVLSELGCLIIVPPENADRAAEILKRLVWSDPDDLFGVER